MIEDPHITLGVKPGATSEEVKRAYRKKVKEVHPDLNGGASEAFRLVQEAYEWFKKQGFKAGPWTSKPSGNGSAIPDPPNLRDVKQLVREFMQQQSIVVQFDGSFAQADWRMAVSPEDVDHALGHGNLDAGLLVDDVTLSFHRRRISVGRGLIQAAVRIITREDQRDRLKTIMRPLLVTSLSPAEQREADEQWLRLVRIAFDMPCHLGVAVLRKFIHQVKTKSLRRPVKRHLMPVIQGRVQGGGKTTTVLKFLEPLRDLRTEPALLADFIDRRSGDIYRYPAVFIDDVDQVLPSQIPILNSLVTGEGLTRRRLGTSWTRSLKQRSTLIGTCNRPLSDLIPDETGNRRFANMPFRNGEVAKGGDPRVWAVIDSTDYELLWRSVDVFGPDPVEEVLADLVRWQEGHRRLSPVEAWVLSLDLTSEEVLAITTPNGIRASTLYKLFREQTGEVVSQTAFGTEIRGMIDKGRGPFGTRVERRDADYYTVRQPQAPHALAHGW